MILPKVTSVSAVEKYKLNVQYNDGTNGLVDLSDLAGKGVFQYWDEKADNFFNVYIAKQCGAIAWSDDLDIDPMNVYFQLKGISSEKWKTQH